METTTVEITASELEKLRQSAAREVVLKQKQAERDEMNSALRAKLEGCKHLRSSIKKIDAEMASIIAAETPVVDQPVQLRMPFGVSDSPLSATGLRKSLRTLLQAAGIERVPDLVAVVQGQSAKHTDGLEGIEGINQSQAKQIESALQAYLEKDPSRPKAEPANPQVADVDWPDEAKILVDTAPGFEKDSIVKGKLHDDGSFVVEGYSFVEGEYEVVSNASA